MGLLFKTKLEKAQEETRRHQAAAADPASSAWVSANAGTGKTHVLTNRVLRLLLAGTAPERILALTFTKAAAAEMSKRVFERLAEWVTASDDALKNKLGDLLGRSPSSSEKQRARRLFATAIETPGGLKVQTIHAFCERLLQRFPLEGDVPPGFAILDDHQREVLLRQAVDAMLGAATSNKAGPLWSALQTAIAYAVEDGFDRMLPELFAHFGSREAYLTTEALAGVERQLRSACGVRDGATIEGLAEELAGVFSDEMMPVLATALRAGGARDVEQAENLQRAVGAGSTSGKIQALARYFLTQENEPRKRLIAKAVSDAQPNLALQLSRAQDRFVALQAEQQGLKVVEATVSLLRLGADVLDRYSAAKARHAALDFDDLVAKAASLLSSSEAVAWVLYKLDGGLDHILVDEAQDTSPLQWQVIRSLADEFFAGSGAREAIRTLFAVGDEKQSIYGFQGAAPNMFAEVGESFAKRAERAHLAWQHIPLTLSFRAVEPLLTAVDRIFEAPSRAPGVAAEGRPPQHISNRAGQAGLIEIWPSEKPQAVETSEPWSPLADASASSPVARLAARIAAMIEGWLKSGEILESENRPVRAGDILILVRKRAPFAPAMVSALKARGIRVAGADRLVLTEQIGVQDLIALGDFVNLPEDDLALAAVLKSPLFGLDDDDLLQLAAQRKGSLWQELVARASQNPRWQEAEAALQRLRTRALLVPPFEFYAALLEEGGRSRMLARLGAEAADPIDEFLNLALTYDGISAPSLQGFLSWVRVGRQQIKRDMEQGRDEVRVMTVHGAKGLEAPIVFLPDTCSTRSGRGSLLKLADAAGPPAHLPPFLWPVKGTSNLGVIRRAKQAAESADTEERNRLLYVALTRARDRIYVAGFEGKNAPPDDCWYNLIKEGLKGHLQEIEEQDGRIVRRLKGTQSKPHEKTSTTAPMPGVQMPLPEWATQKAPQEPLLAVSLSPSHLAPLEADASAKRFGARLAEPAILPPLALAQDSRFLRGTLTHALLEHLPGMPKERWPAAAKALIASRGAELPAGTRESIAKETLAILNDPQFASLFGPESRAEVAVVAEVERPDGRSPALRLSGKIDRLVEDRRSVLIVDYKTNRPPPHELTGVAEAYLLQLAAYRLAMQRIFPGRSIRAAILWTDGPRIMEIPEKMLEIHQQRLWELQATRLDA